ncbi:unnamed protein product [Amoebophrya sp. A25]|nr:unnamed protein product [Amoebophrya sp. A25]|eukprot:GSA25T00018842001.1
MTATSRCLLQARARHGSFVESHRFVCACGSSSSSSKGNHRGVRQNVYTLQNATRNLSSSCFRPLADYTSTKTCGASATKTTRRWTSYSSSCAETASSTSRDEAIRGEQSRANNQKTGAADEEGSHPSSRVWANAGGASAAGVLGLGALIIGGGSVFAAETDDADAIASGAKILPYDPDGQRYGPSYAGRVRAIREMIEPSMLLTSEAELGRALALLSTWKRGRIYTDEENTAFWEAQKIVKSMVHPVTEEVMFLPGRMAAFIPVNTPTALGMLLHGPTSPAAGAFWQFMNQAGNFMTNYVNRSGASVDATNLAISFASACFAGVTVALGMGRLVATYPVLQSLGLFVPYVAVCSASTANMFLTRREEWTNGIPVCDKDGRELGMSPKAGFEAVWQTVTTRGFVTPMPILILPPIIIMGLRTLVRNKRLLQFAEVSTVVGCMYYFLPFTLALQPQKMTLKPEFLEERFQNLKDKQGKPVVEIFANKGL